MITTPVQRTVHASLAELPDAVARAKVKPPAIVLVGAVAARRETIAWLERRPLFGRRVVVTRARAQASGLAATVALASARASSPASASAWNRRHAPFGLVTQIRE